MCCDTCRHICMHTRAHIHTHVIKNKVKNDWTPECRSLLIETCPLHTCAYTNMYICIPDTNTKLTFVMAQNTVNYRVPAVAHFEKASGRLTGTWWGGDRGLRAHTRQEEASGQWECLRSGFGTGSITVCICPNKMNCELFKTHE